MMTSAPSRVSRVAARFTSPADVALAIRIMTWACVLPVLKRVMPIRSLVQLVWRDARLAPDADRDERVVVFARWACRLVRWRDGGNCLERGLIAYRFLLEGARGADTGDRHGTQRRGKRDRPCVGAVERQRRLENPRPPSRQYVPVFAFAPDGSLIRS